MGSTHTGTLAEQVTGNWLSADLWESLGTLLALTLAVRILTLAWLLRAQTGRRSRTVAGPRRRDIREHFTGDASQRTYALRQLELGYPRHLVASVLDPLVSVAAVGAMAWLMSYENSLDPRQYPNSASLYAFLENPPHPSIWLVQAFDHDYDGGFSTVLICLALALLWLGAWYRTRYLLHVVHTPSGTWEQSRLRHWLLPQLVVRFLAVLLLLPVAAQLTLLLWQLVALLAARRFRSRRPLMVPLPVVGGPITGAVPRTTSAMWTPPPYTAPPARAAERAAERAAATPTPVQTPPPMPRTAPSTPAPVPTPTRPATAVASEPAGRPLPTPVVRCQPLAAHEPRVLGPYQLLGRIGSGGMGTVYVACLEGSATQVALKTLKPELLGDPELAQRFQREGEALARVSSAYTARVIDSGIAGGIPFIAMDLLDGSPLDAYLQNRGPIDSPDALRSFALALAAALDGVHRSGLVHRDLKPANIMLTTAGPRLLDFGIAVMLDRTRLTRSGMGGIGTLPYMAPEQFRDEPAGPWTDIWAWGCCMVTATSGRSPFHGSNTAGIMHRVMVTGPDEAAIAPLARISRPLHDVVRLALTPDTARRPADGNALLNALLPGPERPPDLGEQITRGWRTLRL